MEYFDIHNPDAALIQPDWHGWIHHVFDETPDEMRAIEAKKDGTRVFETEKSLLKGSDATISTYVGFNEDKNAHLPHHNLTQYRL